MTALERRKVNKSLSCHSTAEILSISTCSKNDDEDSLSFHLGPESFIREVWFNKTPLSAAKQLWSHTTAPRGAFWQRVYALSLACVQQPYQAFCAQACLCLVMRRQITGPKQSCYSAPAPPQMQPSTQISHARQAKGVLLHITCGLYVAMGCSGPELEAKESL